MVYIFYDTSWTLRQEMTRDMKFTDTLSFLQKSIKVCSGLWTLDKQGDDQGLWNVQVEEMLEGVEDLVAEEIVCN